jgi:hypothetical protein
LKQSHQRAIDIAESKQAQVIACDRFLS